MNGDYYSIVVFMKEIKLFFTVPIFNIGKQTYTGYYRQYSQKKIHNRFPSELSFVLILPFPWGET